ncbi:hypothetical protein GCM10009736_59900 [Actinomadura bangladeshensis]|uniref:Uncharacterized protein n=1 Tax=Actinomadura bangladeshensis TaxID=453573 RepID=A0A4R4PC51_9ACTN|nr:hypothetical protein E1284_02515 [Actinomadura bangladeshensis]
MAQSVNDALQQTTGHPARTYAQWTADPLADLGRRPTRRDGDRHPRQVHWKDSAMAQLNLRAADQRPEVQSPGGVQFRQLPHPGPTRPGGAGTSGPGLVAVSEGP